MPVPACSPRAVYFRGKGGHRGLGSGGSIPVASPSSSTLSPELAELGRSPSQCPPWSDDATGRAVTISPAVSFCPRLPCKINGLLSCIYPPVAAGCVSLRALEELKVDEARAEPAGCSSSRLTVGKGLQGPPRCRHLRHGGALQAFQLSSGSFRAVTALPCKKHPLTRTGGSAGAGGCHWSRQGAGGPKGLPWISIAQAKGCASH